MAQYNVVVKQLVVVPSDPADREEYNLDLCGTREYEYTADSEDEALTAFHSEVPIGNLEDYRVTVTADDDDDISEDEED